MTIAAMMAAASAGIFNFVVSDMQLTFAVSDVITDLPDALLREIGRTMVLSAKLEWTLSRFVFALLRIDRNEGRTAVREPRAAERFDMACELLAYKDRKSKANLSHLRARIQHCDDMRNLISHATWVCEPVHNTLRMIKTGGQWQPTPDHPPKTKRKIHPEAVLFEEAEALESDSK